MPDTSLVPELLRWKSQAELREIQVDIGLVGDVYSPGPSAVPDEARMAFRALLWKNEQVDRDSCYANRAMQTHHSRLVYSKYCDKHTCRFFYSIGGCAFKKPDFDVFCNNHAVCPACPSGHYQCKWQYLDPQHADSNYCQFLRHEYCSDHICSEPNCEMIRDVLSPDKYSRFCIRHRCYYKDCDEQSVGKGGHCAEHKCQFQNCARLSANGFALCKKHVECGQSGCSNPRGVLQEGRNGATDMDRIDGTVQVYDKKLYLLFCPEHGMCAENACHGLRLKDAAHCRVHACAERGCLRSHKDQSAYCEAHRCKTANCHSARAWKEGLLAREDFCSAHLCRDGDCSKGVEDLHRLYCEEHECSNPGCVSQLSGDGLCHEHAILENTETVKEASKAESQDWIRLLHRIDYNIAGSTSSPVLGGGGFHGLSLPPRPSAPYRSKLGRLPRDRPPSPDTSVTSDFDDLEEEIRGRRRESLDGPVRPSVNNISSNSGKDSIPPVNGRPAQPTSVPANKQQPINGQGTPVVRGNWQPNL